MRLSNKLSRAAVLAFLPVVAVQGRREFSRSELGGVLQSFASDGFHPGPALHEAFAHEIADRMPLPYLLRSAP